MTKTMIERVARAMASASGEAWWVYPDQWGRRTWQTRDEYMARARAAIAAMREPTEGMVGEGVECRQHDGGVTHIYRAMIDAALKEAPDA